MTGLVNMTVHACEQVLARDRGRQIRRVACRARWALGGEAQTARAPSFCDRFSPQGELVLASDFGPPRVGTTVLVTGCIVSPDPERIDVVPASIAIAGARWAAVAYPPRVWVASETTSPQSFEARATGPFEPVAASFAQAFGGPDVESNPVGIGALSPGDSPEGRPLPRVEAPEAPLLDPFGRPPPRAIGLVAPGWSPRKELAGTYDERWRRTRAPELPEDASPRLFDPGSFVVEPKVRGGERIDVTNFGAPGLRSSVVPRVLVRFVLARRSVRPEVDELHLDLEAGTIELLLRADLPWDGSPSPEPIFVRELRVAPKVGQNGLHIQGSES